MGREKVFEMLGRQKRSNYMCFIPSEKKKTIVEN